MAKKILSPEELVETHKPKNVKFKYIFTDDSLLNELLVAKYPMDTLDTIGDDKLTEAAMFANYSDYERTIIGKSNSPVFLDNGVVVSKKLVTKADKKLQKVSIGFFVYNDAHYVAIKLVYERFAILEIFSLVK